MELTDILHALASAGSAEATATLIEQTMSNYSEIILDPRGNTYIGPVAQPFSYGALKLPDTFVLDSNTELFHVFEITDDMRVIQRAAVSSRATAQNYMGPNRVCVYKSCPDIKDAPIPESVEKNGNKVILTFGEENEAATCAAALKKLYKFMC